MDKYRMSQILTTLYTLISNSGHHILSFKVVNPLEIKTYRLNSTF